MFSDLNSTTVSNSIDFFPFPKVPGVITPLRQVIALSFFVVPEHTKSYVGDMAVTSLLPLHFGCVVSGRRLLLLLHSINRDCPLKAATCQNRHLSQLPTISVAALAIVRPFSGKMLPRRCQHAAETQLNLQCCHGIYIGKKGHKEDP